jgi:hypothetical protein
MLPSEILERSRSSALRIRAIDAEIRELHEKIGVQGHSYGFHGKNDIRDPMRKVDEMIDGTMDLEMERAECQRDVMAALKVIDGMRALDALSKGRFTTDAEYVLSEYFVYARSIAEVAGGTGYPADMTMKVIDANLAFCDEIGCAGLYAARNRGIDAEYS